MAQSIITLAFETYKAQQEALATSVELNEFVLALVPNQTPNAPIDRNETVPPSHQIVHVAEVTQTGFVNPNAVVYSLIMDTRVGDFEFNWVGLRNKQSGVLAAILHIPTVSKFKSIPGVQNGNSVTRSILMSYEGAQQATGITVDASTWQIDFTARLFGIDEAERLANADLYGPAAFLSDGFKITKSGSVYRANQGCGYVGGLRCPLEQDVTLSHVTPSTGIYLDASWQGHLTSQWQTVCELKVSATPLTNYVDSDGYPHYVTKVADIDGAGNVIDRRHVEGFAQYYPKNEADELLSKKVDKASITDSVTSVSSVLVASAKALKTTYDKAVSAYNLASSKWTYAVATTTSYGATMLSGSVASGDTTVAATSSAVKAAFDKAVSAYNLASSKWTYAVATTTSYGATMLSGSVASGDTTVAATSSAVKAAFDKAVEAYNLAHSKWNYTVATTYVYGVTKLSGSVSSGSTTLAATSSAVKAAYDLAATKITKAQGDMYYLGRNNKAIAAQQADTIRVQEANSDTFYNLTWHNGNALYSCASGEGFNYRPSDGFSKVKHGYIAGTYLYHQSDGKVVAHNTNKRSSGLYGIFDSHRIDHIWSMGIAYTIDDDGASFGNLYGLAYKNINNPTGGEMAGGHQAVWCENGQPKAAMGQDGLWGRYVYDGPGDNRQRVYSPSNKPLSVKLWEGSATTVTLSESITTYRLLYIRIGTFVWASYPMTSLLPTADILGKTINLASGSDGATSYQMGVTVSGDGKTISAFSRGSIQAIYGVI
ncbi:phage tail protein [Vibrio sp. Of7-15]|uniref:phage tail-collar fiber domain-containing protein n=1 Tax=Vibrio sp. Of7-15 TaxID=2724879 RepID=UPI001EF176E3|nr:phage tail protein [Vibrio sp. Of7-15]MCG7499381.1 phage tail protein [Vibrio sp. Of7-15]